MIEELKRQLQIQQAKVDEIKKLIGLAEEVEKGYKKFLDEMSKEDKLVRDAQPKITYVIDRLGNPNRTKCLWQSIPEEQRMKPMGVSCRCLTCSPQSLIFSALKGREYESAQARPLYFLDMSKYNISDEVLGLLENGLANKVSAGYPNQR